MYSLACLIGLLLKLSMLVRHLVCMVAPWLKITMFDQTGILMTNIIMVNKCFPKNLWIDIVCKLLNDTGGLCLCHIGAILTILKSDSQAPLLFSMDRKYCICRSTSLMKPLWPVTLAGSLLRLVQRLPCLSLYHITKAYSVEACAWLCCTMCSWSQTIQTSLVLLFPGVRGRFLMPDKHWYFVMWQWLMLDGSEISTFFGMESQLLV
jgi:hypothetical protein